MNWNDNNNPWGSGGNGNNPWGKGPSNQDFENTIRKAKDRFGKFKNRSPRTFQYFCFLQLSCG